MHDIFIFVEHFIHMDVLVDMSKLCVSALPCLACVRWTFWRRNEKIRLHTNIHDLMCEFR